jgi:GTP-binding protein Era
MNQEPDIIQENEALPDDHRSGFVAVVGRPNVGKSTLMNAFLGQKIAIVTPRPQTTRLRQLGILTTDQYQIIFVDTPGLLQTPRHKLDEFMIAAVSDAYRGADLVLWLVDASEPPGPNDRALADQLQGLRDETPVIVGLNKSDLLDPEEVLPRTAAYQALLPGAPWLLFSALEGHGRDALLELIVEHLPEGPRFYPADQITETFVRDIAGEMVREQLMLQLRDEVPYGTTVRVEEYKERENDLTYIQATILVEREAHKAIVIGKKGRQLQQIGAAARKEIEALVDGPVYLDLWVKVEPGWRQDEKALDRLGYQRDDR